MEVGRVSNSVSDPYLTPDDSDQYPYVDQGCFTDCQGLFADPQGLYTDHQGLYTDHQGLYTDHQGLYTDHVLLNESNPLVSSLEMYKMSCENGDATNNNSIYITEYGDFDSKKIDWDNVYELPSNGVNELVEKLEEKVAEAEMDGVILDNFLGKETPLKRRRVKKDFVVKQCYIEDVECRFSDDEICAEKAQMSPNELLSQEEKFNLNLAEQMNLNREEEIRTNEVKRVRSIQEREMPKNERKRKRINATCMYCGKTFPDLSHLNEHELIHTGDKPHLCNYCGKAFRQVSSLNRHLRIHTGDRPYQCAYCQRAFKQSNQLHVHEKMKHSENKGQSRKVLESCYLKLNEGQEKTKTVNLTCSFCHELFTSTKDLKRHAKIHKETKPHKCSFCGKAFDRYSHMVRHERIHTGEKPYTCSYCDKTFSQIICKKVHERVHVRVDGHAYSCNECGIEFSDSSSFRKHRNSHKLLKCLQCDAVFVRASFLKKHEQKHAENSSYDPRSGCGGSKRKRKIHECEVCGETFLRIRCLKEHQKKSHTESIILVDDVEEGQGDGENLRTREMSEVHIKVKNVPYLTVGTKPYKPPRSDGRVQTNVEIEIDFSDVCMTKTSGS